MKVRGVTWAVALVLAIGACDSLTGPEGPTAPVTLSFMVASTPAGPPAARLFGAAEYSVSDGSNQLVIQSAELVLREIEFERVEDLAGCDAEEGEVEGSDDDACEKYVTDPVLVSLPLDGSVDLGITAELPYGDYDEIEFEVHKVSGDDPADAAFLDANPGYDGISVKVTGTWNSEPFVYTNDLDEDQEVELLTPMVIDENSGPVNVTLSVDISTWFTNGTLLIDPNSALKNGANEQLVEDNIEASIEGFEDDDSDGVPHDDDDDEDDAV